MKKSKATSGGERPGAGRPRIGTRLHIELQSNILDALDRVSQNLKISRSALIRDILNNWAEGKIGD